MICLRGGRQLIFLQIYRVSFKNFHFIFCNYHNGIYFGATGGAGALLGKQITAAEVIAYPELGPEAIRKLTVKDFPVTVINDTQGNDLYQMGRAQYEVKD